MNDYVNIFKSNLVMAENDAYWVGADEPPVNVVPKPVLIVVNHFEPGSLEETQLRKMLEACRLRPEQYHIEKVKESQKVSWSQLRASIKPEVVFLIGIMPAQLGVSVLLRLNEPNNFNDCIWLPTIPIGELEKFADIKKQLWTNGMKPVFVDKTTLALK